VNPLIEQAAQTDSVQAHAPLLGPHVWIDVELTARVAIHMTIQARHSGAGGKSNMFCIWAMCDTWIRSRMFMPFLIA
jgi:hypothetical protein